MVNWGSMTTSAPMTIGRTSSFTTPVTGSLREYVFSSVNSSTVEIQFTMVEWE